jgi:pSer/pThr/pTyr-binding forkhead associated (FHA) protein
MLLPGYLVGESVNLKIVIVSAIVGVVASLVTAYFTTRFRMKEEKEKWRRELPVKFAAAQTTDNLHTQKLAVQFATAFLIKNPETEEREKIFIPPNCRLIVGRAQDSHICIDDPRISRYQCAFVADDVDVYVEDLHSQNSGTINGVVFKGKQRLKAGDIITIGATTLEFHKLSD